jgi:hypothetical protein
MFKNKYFTVAIILGALLIAYQLYKRFNEVSADENNDADNGTKKSILPASITTFDKYAGTRASGSDVTERVFCQSGQVYDKTTAMCVDIPSNMRKGKLKKRTRKMRKRQPRFY